MDEEESMENQEVILESIEVGESISETSSDDWEQVIMITEDIRSGIQNTNSLICLSLGLIIGILIIRMVLSK